MELIKQCSYIGCKRLRIKGDKFHCLPIKNSALCVKWLINIGREDLLTQESATLESMNIAICGDHFQDDDYLYNGTLKKDSVPIQYWDHVGSSEFDEANEIDIEQQLLNASYDSCTSIDSESETDDEFRTRLGNEIEVLLNSIKKINNRSENKKNTDLDQSIRNFYKKLNLKDIQDKSRNVATSANNLIEFKKATKDLCRTCAMKKNNLVNIADKMIHSNVDIITKLKLLIEIKEHDILPKKICQECLIKLEQSYEFFQQIYKADTTLRDMLFTYKQSNKNISNRDKYNGHAVCPRRGLKTKNGNGNEIKNFSLEINNLPFKNSSKSTLKLSDSYEFNDSHDSINSEIDSSENTENTVSYLLSDCCDNDAELNWQDVVGAMKKKRKSDVSTSNTDVEKLPTNTLQISCKYCNRSFRLRRQLKTHITTEHLQPANYSCEYCHVRCKSKEHLSEHHAQVHLEQIYNCNDCSKKFSKKEELLLHIERIHSNKGSTIEMNNKEISHSDQTFICNDCGKTFSSKKNLCNHIHRLHPPFTYTCTICNSVMYSAADTYEHMMTHNKSPLFPCHDCGKMFYSNEKLDKHRSTHGKSMPKKRKMVWFHCQLCDASYRIADELIKHIETHSSEDWQKYRNKILYCGECNAKLIGNEKFQIHKMKYHLTKRGDFVCLLCDNVTKDFQSLDDYEKHINSHSNDLKCSVPRWFKCEHCNKAFESNSHLLNHMDSFHSDVMLSCPDCDIKIKYKENLKDHIDKVHKKSSSV